ncbi:MAG: PPC domain-containing protein [Myxococcaceae bacterium]|nr:PPC domain-containing protein [Myxococcaceae bacterium]
MSRSLKVASLAFCALVITAGLAGCPGGEEPQEPCEGVVCGPGRCVVSEGRAACECEPGHHPEGLTCVEDDQPPKNPCEPNPCMQPDRGQCSSVDGGAVCGCTPGTQEGDGGVCVPPNPCEPNPCTTPNKTDCSVSNGQPVCACVSGYLPEGEGCVPEPTITCEGQHSAGDTFEPDECPALARDVGPGGAQNEGHTLSPVADEDWFKLTAVAGHVYEAVATGAAGARLDLDLYAADGSTVLVSDHSGQAGVQIVHKATVSGALFVRVRAFVPGETGAYSITLQDLGEDDFADEPALATTLTAPSGTPVSGALQFGGDRDVVKLALSAGHSYRFEAAWTEPSTAALRLELLAPDRTTVVGSNEAVAPQLLTRITSAGDYYLRLQEPTGKVRAGYAFTVTDLGADDHGDGPSESSPVIIDGPAVPGGFERPGDVDVFSFNAQAGHIYAFTCNPGGGAADCLVSLSDSAGDVLATDNNGGTGYILYEYMQAGTYYFRLSSSTVGSYTYQLEDLGFDDHGDTRETATDITSFATPTGARLEVPGDVDFLRFSAETERIYSFTCTSIAFPCAVELQDAAGAVLASGTATADSLELSHTFTSAGTAYVRISSGAASGTGSYTWLLRSEHVDDHGDTIDTATPISAGAGVATGQLEELGDVDVFRFSATAGHIYRFTCGSNAHDCDVELLDASGAVIVSATGPETTAIITYEFNTGGVWYYRVRTDASATGAYTYTLEDLGVDDHGDASSDATALSAPASGTGRLELEGDVDVFSFSGAAEEVYEFTCTGTSVDCNVLLVDSNGTTVASDTAAGANAKITYRLSQAGTWFLHVKSTPESTGSYGYQLVNLGTDEHGNTPGTATPVVVGAPAAGGRIDTPGDVDVFSFDALAGHIYELTCTSTNLSCELQLMNGAGTVLAFDSGASAKILYEMGPGGTYYTRIAGGAGAVGTYTYRIVDLGLDDYGDTLATATAITAGAPVATGTLELSGDVDVFSFQAEASHLYDFTCTGTSIDCNVELLNETGTVLAADTSSNASARVRLQLTAAGTYYLRVVGGGAGNAMGTYGYQLQDLGVDDHGNTSDTATPVTPGAPAQSASIDSASDVDVFSFTALAGHIYRFTCAATFDCNVALADKAGVVLASDTAPAANAVVVFEFSAAGTYFYEISSGNSELGSYTYQLEDLGVDDHGDTAATATPITPSTTASTGQVETLGDVDFFSFAGSANTSYAFSCASTAIDCNVVLYDSNGTVLLSDTRTSTSAKVTYLVRTAATFFVRVYSGTESLGGYTYQLEDLGTDDHGDTIDDATPVLPSTTFSNARINTAADVDVFSFTAEANRIYEIECRSTVFDCNVVLMDSAGGEIASDTGISYNARVRRELSAAGTYYFRVQSGFSGLGDYTYLLEKMGDDDHGDTLATATPITPMASSAPSLIETTKDVDVFAFTATAGHIYEFTCTGATGDCNLELMDSTGTVLVQDYSPVSSASVAYEIGTEGTYYVRLRFGNYSSTQTGSYAYQLRELGMDDHGDTAATATPITPSATTSPGRVETFGDVDFFSFEGAANTSYEFNCTGTTLDCNVVLYDSNGTVLLSDTGPSASARVTYLVRTAATFFVSVHGGLFDIGDYTYQLGDLGTDDHGNSIGDASPVTPSATFATGTINAVGDVDVFSFTAVDNHVYEVECTSTAIDCNVALMNELGAVIAFDNSSSTTARVRAEVSPGGTYSFRVQPGTSALGDYSYRVRDLGLDDHGDSRATATPIAPMASSASGQIETVGDDDFFAFTAAAGQIFEFTCAAAAHDCNLALMDSSGTVLAQDITSSFSARVSQELGAAGTYYVRLWFSNIPSPPYGGYTYQLKDLGTDDHGDSFATATPITPSATSSTGRVETLGDLDHFSFAGSANTTYEFTCSSSAIDCDVVLYDSSGTLVQSDTSSSTSAKVTYLVKLAGTFYVRVYSGTTTIGAYTYQLKDLGMDDHGNTLADATPVTPTSTFSNARIDAAGDVDVFSFIAEAGHIYEAECSTTAFNCNLVLMDSAGTVIVSDTSGATSASVRAELNTAGTYYFRVQPGSFFGDYSYRLRDLGVDDHGDTLATATPILVSASATNAKFEVSGDVDWLSFTAQAGHIYEFTCGSGIINCNVYLTDAAGNTLVSDTSSALSATVRWEFNVEGTYYLRAVAANWSSANDYSYQLQELGVDDHGDTLATATPIVPPTTATDAKFEVAGDEDWFSFTALAGHVYEFSCGTTAINCNVYLTDAAGVTVVSDTATSNSATVRWEFSAEGTYYLRVVAANWNSSNGYSYQLQELGVDDHGDTLATATPIVPTITFVDAKFEVAGDEDWFSFTAQAGHVYEFSCNSGVINCNVYLTDAAGVTVVSDTATTRAATVRWEFSAGGVYYLRVVAADWSSSNSYSYRLQDLGLDDHGDTLATATPIVPITTTTLTSAKFEVAGDEDWFSFTAQAGRIYEFLCFGGIHCDVYLVDAAGNTVVSDTTTAGFGTVRWEFDTGGTYYLRAVAIDWGTSFVNYQYRLQDLGVDDAGDTQATARSITPTLSSLNAKFEVSGDEDWFRFTAQAGHIYDFRCDASSLGCNVYLLDAAGNTLVSGSSASSFAAVRWELNTGGTYYLRVFSTFWTSSSNSYTYWLQDMGLDDHGDTLATATPIAPAGSSTNAKFDVPGDEDWFQFTAQAGHIYTFYCNSLSLNCDAYLMDAAGVTMVSDTRSSSFAQVSWEFSTGGTYYLRAVTVGSWSNGSIGYQYWLRDMGVDDHGDTFATASVSTLGVSAPGNIEFSADLDFFALSLEAGTSYTVTTTGSSTTLTVYGPDQATVLATGSGPLTFTSGAAGAHYIQVQGVGTATGAYTVTVQ